MFGSVFSARKPQNRSFGAFKVRRLIRLALPSEEMRQGRQLRPPDPTPPRIRDKNVLPSRSYFPTEIQQATEGLSSCYGDSVLNHSIQRFTRK